MTKMTRVPKYSLTSDVAELFGFLGFHLELVSQNGRLFAKLVGTLLDDGERREVLVPLHDAVSRIVHGFDPDYVKETEYDSDAPKQD